MNCKEATRLMSEAQDRPLGGGEGASLKFHLFICRGCSNFRRQLAALRDICRRYPNEGAGEENGRSDQP